MKLLILLAAVAVANCAKLNRNYLPPDNARSSGGSAQILETPNYSSPSQRSNGFVQNPAQDGYNNDGNDYNDNVNGFAQQGNGFSQQGNGFSQQGNGFAQRSNGFDQQAGFAAQESGFDRPERPQAAFERSANILRLDNQNDGDTYSYAFETENGISAEERGVATNGVEAQGGFSYTGDDGQVYSIRYTADQNGFLPQGDHLPTPPPIPEEILKALEKNAQDEAAGIFDDGTYNEAKYGDSAQQYNNNNNNNGYDYQSNNNINNNYESNNFANDDTVTISSAAITAPNKYLAPLRNEQPAAPSFRNAGNQNYSNQAQRRSGPSNQYLAPRSNGVTKAYLPPIRQPSFRNSNFGQRRQPNRSNNGYNY